MDWMYKGLSGNVDREEYLTGRKIDKTFEMIEKEENPNALKDEEDNAFINQLASQSTYNDNFYKNDYTAKMREDPLYAIRMKQQEHRKQLLQNPLKLKQLETILKSSLEKDKKKHKSKKKSKKHKNHKKSSKERRASSSRESTPERTKNPTKSEKSHDKFMSSSSTAKEPSHDRRDNRHKNIKKHESNSSSRSRTERHQVPTRSYSSHRNEIRHKERPSKHALSEEELKRKREEMMQNATWREETRADKLKRLEKEESRIDESSKSSLKVGAQFIKPLLTNIASSNSIEDSIRKKRFTSQTGVGSMDVNFARRT